MSVVIENKVDTKTKLKKPPKFNIWAIDNDYTSFDEVVWVLTKAFNMSISVASELTMKVDNEGKAKVNPKPMSRGIAEAQIRRIQELKKSLAQIRPHRSREIKMLEFKMKEE